ncbi:MAG: elongation factor G [bacterium]
MKEYQIDKMRSIGIIAHNGDGKTSLAEAILFDTKMVSRLGRVNDKTSNLDYDPDEIARSITIFSTPTFCEWQKHKINIIDTPGELNFISDTKTAFYGVENIVVVISAVSGIKSLTNSLWQHNKSFNLPSIVFINKMDRERADLQRAFDSLSELADMHPVLLQLPIGKEHEFKGVVDLLKQKAYIYSPNNSSGEFTREDIPGDLKNEVDTYREKMIETIAEADDALLEKYLDAGELSDEEIIKGLKKGIRDRAFTPVVCGSALNNIGIQPFLDIIIDFFPSPAERPPAIGKNPKGEEIQREPRIDAPFSAFVFKIIADPYAGKLTVFKVLSGTLSSDSQVYNATQEKREKVGQILFLEGKNNHPVSQVKVGDIAAIAKLKGTRSADTLCAETDPIIYPPIEVVNPVISYAIEPKSSADDEKVSTALARLCEEDPTLKISRDPQTKEFILSGMGQIHIAVAVERMKRKFGAEVIMKTPKVPYKETIHGSTKVQGKYKKQTGGRGQYGDTWLQIDPLPPGGGFEFVNAIVGGAIPRQYIPAVEKGIMGAMEEGILAGYPITDVKVTLYDGSFHSVDSSEMAFKIAASMGFKRGFMECKPGLLEPIMNIEVTVPEECVGDIMGDMNSKRGRVQGVDSQGNMQTVKAQIPMAEILKYAPELKSMTSGRGIFTMEFSHYEEVPAHLAEKIIAESKKKTEEA